MPERYTRRRMGDRSDGRRLRTVSPVFLLTPFLMRSPSDTLHSFTDHTDTAAMEAWLKEKRAEGREDISLVHIFIAAYVRTLAHRPAMNRFVSGRFIYARDRIDVVLSSGRSGSAENGARSAKVHFLPTDTIYDVCRKINSQLDGLKADEEAGRMERLAATLVKTPRFLLRAATAVIRWLDYHGWLGDGWIEASPFHCSIMLTDLASIKTNSIHHHIYNFGTLPVFLAFGTKRHAYEVDKYGNVLDKKYVDAKAVVDEGIVDGHYFAQFFQAYQYMFAHPEILEAPPTKVVEDIF